jgi:hypothetical protein
MGFDDRQEISRDQWSRHIRRDVAGSCFRQVTKSLILSKCTTDRRGRSAKVRIVIQLDRKGGRFGFRLENSQEWRRTADTSVYSS